ncbi:flagellar protein FlaG [Reinekea marina]|uniref:Flagellar protein FlaG n=1 Tax=Reinekea marina TaxID=1310421 RepID=A0ABV7WVY7_9GAMM|nr:flagellar protein FlaG [Reinekea marina]MDN3649233.1 flagellar protein FlaG [Reinekea marina]
MNEISMQPSLNAKPSAPTRDTGKSGFNGIKPTVEQAEARQAEKSDSVTSYASQQKEAAEKPKEESVEQAVAKLNDYVQNTERKLEFQLDEDSGKTVIRVYDKVSDELIRQMPNEEALELAQRLSQEEPLMLFSAQV